MRWLPCATTTPVESDTSRMNLRFLLLEGKNNVLDLSNENLGTNHLENLWKRHKNFSIEARMTWSEVLLR